MMLLTILFAPLGVWVLFVVMAWAERALDVPLQLQASPGTRRTLPDRLPAVTTSVTIDQTAVR